MVFITAWILSKYLKLNMNFIVTTCIEMINRNIFTFYLFEETSASSVAHNTTYLPGIF